VLDIMDRYPDVTYSQSQASVYALVEKHFPEMFEEIKKRVKEGRWEVTAVHWVEGDKNIASGEALCRHMLQARRYFEEKFGLKPEDVPVDWEPDTFGHAHSIPGFLTRGGAKYYYCCRPGGGAEHARVGEERPWFFTWEGLDGSRVLVHVDKTWYGGDPRPGENVAMPMVDFHQKTGLRDWLLVYGIGNHGGGPTRAAIEYLKSVQEWPIYPKLVFSTVKRYMEAAEADIRDRDLKIPVLDHELNFEFTGCYTSQSLIKQANRFGENYLLEAETLATLAARLTGQKYQGDLLREGWVDTLFSHFHDILPGSGVRETRERAMGMFQGVGAITGGIKRRAATALVADLDTASLLPDTADAKQELELIANGKADACWEAGPGAGAGLTGLSRASSGGRRFHPFVVYNPCAWKRTEAVTVSVFDADLDPSRVVAIDENGAARSTLFLGRSDYWGHMEYKFTFTADDVPATGYRTFLLCEGTPDQLADGIENKPGEWFESPALRVRFDRYRSGILEIQDKRTGWSFAGEGADTFAALKLVCERPRGMTAWIMGHETEPPQDLIAESYRVTGSGPCVLVERDLVVPGTKSRAKLQVAVHAFKPQIDFTLDLDWREIGEPNAIPSLRLCLPLNMPSPKAVYEIPFGSVERGPMGGEEVPALRYAHIHSVPSRGGVHSGSLTLLQDCKYGHTFREGSDPSLSLTIVRSTTDPDHAPEVARSTIRYAVCFHDTPASRADLTRLGAAFNHPLIVFPARMRNGSRPTIQGFVEELTPNVVVSSLKNAEDGDGLIVRLVEHNGVSTDARVRLSPELLQGIGSAVPVDLIERPAAGRATLDGGVLSAHVPAHGITTVRLR
jgi:alpha-mannosidase